MGITHSDKTISTARIGCGETFRIRLSITATPDIADNPTDIALILDRSESMKGSPLEYLKEGAKAFIDVIEQSTDGTDGEIGGGSRIGIVSFSTSATTDAPMITSVQTLDDAVDALKADGFTNHADAFTKALALFDPTSDHAKVMVMFTDGKTTAGGNAAAVAAAAKAQGVDIYVIGLIGDGGIDEAAIKLWASDPDSEFVAITPDDEQLVELFESIARAVVRPGATNINITDRINDCFTILSITSPTRGTASLLDPTTVHWHIDSLGDTQPQEASFEFTVRHTGTCSGDTVVNESVAYHDAENHIVTFPDPRIFVDCGIIITPEGCPEPFDVRFDGCQDALTFNAGDVALQSTGRILSVNVTLRNICPRRRAALAVILTELDHNGNEHRRGLKTITIPAHNRATCQDVAVECIKFVLPEDIDEFSNCGCICNSREFRVRFLANYIDNDFDCCRLIDEDMHEE